VVPPGVFIKDCQVFIYK